MKRRQFLTASLATTAVALAGETAAPAQPAAKREYYQIRRYSLATGPETRLTEDYFGNALIPALSRMGMGPIGAFRLEIGPETPQFYLLIPGPSAESLATVDLQLAKDDNFLKQASPHWNATAAAPAFQRIETSLLIAFEGWPRITPPASSASKGKRIFQLRTYESPSNLEHIRKVEMFHSGEFDFFQRSGCHPVFFGDTLIGTRACPASPTCSALKTQPLSTPAGSSSVTILTGRSSRPTRASHSTPSSPTSPTLS